MTSPMYLKTSIFEAQAYTNFVVLNPTTLPKGCSLKNISVLKETPKERSILRFEVVEETRSFRVKQFFYDWGIPIIYADTNLTSQGTPFVVDGIVGFIGQDYKKNRAACYAK